MGETLASFWKKLQLGTKIKVIHTDHNKDKMTVSSGEIIILQGNAVARDGSKGNIRDYFTKEKPCYFSKPKASECEISENKLIEYNKKCSTTIIYEILEDEV